MKKTNDHKDFYSKVTTVLFFSGYSLFLITSFLINNTFVKENQMTLVGIGAALIVTEVIMNLTLGRLPKNKQFLWILPIMALALVSCLVTHDLNILMLIAVIIGAATMSFDAFVKKDIIIRFAIAVFIIMLFMLELTPSGNVMRDGSIRYALGFQHPNTLGMQIMILTMEFYYIFRKHRLITLLTTISAIAFLLLVPNSRAATVILAVLAIYILFNKTSRKILRLRVVKFIITLSFPILTAISLVLATLGASNPELAMSIDEATSGRLTLYSQAMEDAGVTIIGNSHENKLKDALDNAYLRLLVSYGVLQYCVLLLLSVNTFKVLYRGLLHNDERQDDDLIFILFMLQVYGLMESSSVYIQRNSFLNLYGEPLRQSKKRLQNEK